MINRFSALILVFGLISFSCEKESIKESDPLPPISSVPSITLGSMATTYNQFDDIELKVNYIDGNGDLGVSDADTPVIFVTDNRNNIELNFHLLPLAPEGANIAIQGQLQVMVENIILLDQANTSETLTFTVKIVDRAGNWSNSVTTPTITINQ